MRRLQLVELEDLDQVPRAVRDGGTDLLDLAFRKLAFYKGALPKLVEFLRSTGATRIVDLCSGGGGGALMLRDAVRDAGLDVAFELTDRFPNEAGAARVRALNDARTTYRQTSVDAMEGGGEGEGVRTMSSALHHFPPDAVRSLIAGIVARGAPLAFLDIAANPALRKLPLGLAPVAMAFNASMLFVVSLLLVPALRPVRASRFLLTYLVPAIPFLVAWDGTVSAVRAYSPEELLELARSVPGGDGYEWASGVEGAALYLTGRPRA